MARNRLSGILLAGIGLLTLSTSLAAHHGSAAFETDKTWLALDKFPFKLLPPSYDVREMMCSVSEFIEYNKAMGLGIHSGRVHLYPK